MKGQTNLWQLLIGGVLACIFTIGLAASAAAVTVDFHGKALTGVLNTSNAKLLNRAKPDVDPKSATIGVGKFRLRTEVGTDDGRAKMVYGFETGANNFGKDWGYSGDSVDIENRFAYIQSALPGMNDAIYGRAGLQKTGINHWVWTETAAGITLHGEGRINWQTGWYRGIDDYDEDGYEEGHVFDSSDANDDTDLFVVKADFRPLDDVKVGGFGIYALDFQSKKAVEKDADQFWVGLTGEVGGPVFASGDLIYQGGDAGVDGDEDVSAYLVNLTMGAKLNDAQKISFNALYVSGDEDSDDNDQEAFQSIDADVKVGQIFFKDSLAGGLDRFVDDMFGSTMPAGLTNNGLINLALEGEMQMDEKNNLRAAARYLQTAEDDPGVDEDELGYELDLWYTYKMNQNLSFKVEGAYLFPGDLGEYIFGDDDDVYLAAVGAVFQF